MGASCHLAIHAQEAFSMTHQAFRDQRWSLHFARLFMGSFPSQFLFSSCSLSKIKATICAGFATGKPPLVPIVLSASELCGLDKVYKHCLSETQGRSGFVKLVTSQDCDCNSLLACQVEAVGILSDQPDTHT